MRFPKLSRESYYACFFSDIPDPLPQHGGCVAVILNDDNPAFRINIYVDDDFLKKSRANHVLLHIVDENMLNGCSINISREFFDLLYIEDKKYLWAPIWHEVGHYHDYEFLQQKYGPDYNTDALYAERRKSVINGHVTEEDRRADEFSVLYTGKSSVINSLDWLSMRRKARNDLYAKLALEEINLRKRAVKQLKT